MPETRKRTSLPEPPAYLRLRGGAEALGARLWVRVAARLGALCVLGAGLVLGLRDGGLLDGAGALFSGRSAAVVGLAAERIEISGLTLHEPSAVLAALGLNEKGMAALSPAQVRDMLERLDWVKRAEVMRRYPNGLRIVIEERTPVARWRVGGRTVLVDRDGVGMTSLDPARFAALVLVQGAGANRKAAALVNLLSAIPSVSSRVVRATYVGRRRWNLFFRSGLKVLLPERDVGAALQRLAALQERFRVLDRDLARLDLRPRGRIALLPRSRRRALP